MSLELSGTNKVVFDNLNANIKDLLTPKNWIINGGFDVWQRRTSQTSSGYGSDDRFANLHDGISTKTHSRQTFVVGQTDVPNNPTYFSRTIVTSGNTSHSVVYKCQKIEDVTKLAGKIVTISFWAKADSNKNMSIFLLQNFGSGGSSDAVATIQKFALTSTWQKITKTITIPSAVGKTIGANSFLHLHMFFDAGSAYNSFTDSLGNQSGTFDIANISLVEGSVPVEWQTEAYADVLDKCLDYYRVFKHSSNYMWIASGLFVSSTNGNIMLPIGRPMRSTSISVEWSNIHLTDMYSLGQVATAITAIAVIGSVVYIQVTDAGGHTIGRAAFIGTHVGGGYIAVSAEL